MEEVLKPDEAEAAIEALLFTMGEAISAETIGAVIGHDKATVVRLVHRLMDRYQMRREVSVSLNWMVLFRCVRVRRCMIM